MRAQTFLVRLIQHPIPAGTPDSRITSIEAGTTKSFATIPEDDEFSVESDNDRTNEIDLVSIDRVCSGKDLRDFGESGRI